MCEKSETFRIAAGCTLGMLEGLSGIPSPAIHADMHMVMEMDACGRDQLLYFTYFSSYAW